ncbi:hypothetical protein [Amycolatopsis sp. NPDC057786]|uniref:hypothetical protein n=1 Tax=Amycolatopsis sp. NPDC057786 TaxID=3346250 RepID=UPI00366D6112
MRRDAGDRNPVRILMSIGEGNQRMSTEIGDGSALPDFGLVTPVSLPADGRVPDSVTGAATAAEYDGYFRIAREAADLGEWTRSCLSTTGKLLDDLPSGGLTDSERADLMRGLVLVLQSTLERWLTVVETADGR